MWTWTYVAAHLLIALACTWAVLSPRINDGLFGKLALLLLCFASLACAGWVLRWPASVDRSEALFALAIACMALRCYWLKTWAPGLRRHIKRRIRKCS